MAQQGSHIAYRMYDALHGHPKKPAQWWQLETAEQGT
jgi:hypothetical protein